MMNSALPASPVTEPAAPLNIKNGEKPAENVDLDSFSDALEQQEVNKNSDSGVDNSMAESRPGEAAGPMQASGPHDEDSGNSLPASADNLPVEPGKVTEVSPPLQSGIAAQTQGRQTATAAGQKVTDKPASAERILANLNSDGAGKSGAPSVNAAGQARPGSDVLNDPTAIQDRVPTRASLLVEEAQQLFAKGLDEQGGKAIGPARAASVALSTALSPAGLSASALPGAITPAAESNSAALTKMDLPLVEIPPANPRWGGAIAQRAQIAISQGVQQAQIRLTPAHLGTIEMHIQMQDERASVTMISPHASVREMLETATPKLRELLEQQGMTLQQNLVSDHPAHSSPDQASPDLRDHADPATGRDSDDSEVLSGSDRPRVSVGLVDHYV